MKNALIKNYCFAEYEIGKLQVIPYNEFIR